MLHPQIMGPIGRMGHIGLIFDGQTLRGEPAVKSICVLRGTFRHDAVDAPA